MAETVLSGVLDFFRQLGVYDIILPFILVYTLMFAILEKTKLFGTEKIQGTDYTKKNLNAMVSFVVAFLVVASSKLVEAITAVSSKIVILLLLVVFFLMLVGSFYSKEDIESKGVGGALEKPWRIMFGLIIFIGVLFIFLDAITIDTGETWLEVFIGFLSQFASNSAVAALVLIVGIIFFMMWIGREPKGGSS